MSIKASASTRLVPVPIPDRVAVLIGSCMPAHVLQAEIEAECERREVLRFRAPLMSAVLHPDDQADHEAAFSRMARANKVLAAHDPRLVVRPAGAR